MNGLPVIGGPIRAGEAGFVYGTDRGVVSGRIDTSGVDTQVNFGISLDALFSGGGHGARSTMDAEGKGLLLVQGDDTLGTALPFNKDAYLERIKSFGVSVKFEEYPVFLKVWHEARGVFFNLASRACLRSLSRERRAAGRWSELLSSAVRWAVCEKDPFFKFFFQLTVDTCSLWKEERITSYSGLKRRCLEVLPFALKEQESVRAVDFGPLIDGGFFEDSADPFVSMVLSRFGPLRKQAFVPLHELSSASRGIDWTLYERFIRGEASADAIRSYYKTVGV
jgi:hypothetical protein